MGEKIQVQYEAIERLADQIHQQAEQVGVVFQRVRSQTESLAVSWLGDGARAFQREMEEEVLPTKLTQ